MVSEFIKSDKVEYILSYGRIFNMGVTTPGSTLGFPIYIYIYQEEALWKKLYAYLWSELVFSLVFVWVVLWRKRDPVHYSLESLIYFQHEQKRQIRITIIETYKLKLCSAKGTLVSRFELMYCHSKKCLAQSLLELFQWALLRNEQKDEPYST